MPPSRRGSRPPPHRTADPSKSRYLPPYQSPTHPFQSRLSPQILSLLSYCSRWETRLPYRQAASPPHILPPALHMRQECRQRLPHISQRHPGSPLFPPRSPSGTVTYGQHISIFPGPFSSLSLLRFPGPNPCGSNSFNV